MNRLRALAIPFALCMTLLLGGTARADEPNLVVDGTVTFRGVPVADGKILFQLADDEFVGGKIKDGRYRLTRVPAGTWRISLQAKGVPARFASEEASPFRAEVKPGQNSIDLDVK